MFVKVEDGAASNYPYTVDNLRMDNPQVSFPDPAPESLLAEHGVFPVKIAVHPAINADTQDLVYDTMPHEEGGEWVLGVRVEDKPLPVSSANVRGGRDELLRQTDWIVLRALETGNPVPAEWLSYRQALRDIPAQDGFPGSVLWPSKPS